MPRRDAAAAAILVAAAVVPDLDLLFSVHRGPTHSLGAALLAGAVVWVVSRRPAWAVAVGLAWASHVLLDWLGNDTRPPLGVMALWPFSTDYYKARIEVFPAISRQYRFPQFWYFNLKAVAVELVVLLPITALRVRRKRRQ